MFKSFSLFNWALLFSMFLSLVQSCGVKTPPTPLLPSHESDLDAEARARKKEQERANKR
ncbi:MAG: hypothetical protein RJB13_1589 [Pseudomonadota bacterium]